MEHSFSVEVAKQVGVSCATMLRHIVFWVMKNRYNETNFHKGKNWTYNSAKAWSQHFPYWTEKQIRTILNKLSENGFIEVENLNSDKMNHTNWYTITDKTLSIYNLPNWEGRFDQMGKSLYYNTDIVHTYNKEKNNINIISKESGQGELLPPPPTPQNKKFVKPSVEDIESYCKSKNFVATVPIDFWEFYESKGWKVGNAPMKSWQMALNRWERQNQKRQTTGRYGTSNLPTHYTLAQPTKWAWAYTRLYYGEGLPKDWESVPRDKQEAIISYIKKVNNGEELNGL